MTVVLEETIQRGCYDRGLRCNCSSDAAAADEATAATARSTAPVRTQWPSGERGNYILHELLADGANFLAQSSAEHHDLLFVRCVAENLLDISTHICVQI